MSAQLSELGGPSHVAVVHEREEGVGFVYFPLRYAFGPSLRQYVAARKADGSMSLQRLPDRDSELPTGGLAEDRLLLISLRHLGAGDLAAVIRSGLAPSISDDQWSRSLSEAGWQQEGGRVFVAMGATELRWFRRRGP
jgi:hypothetical protein